MSSKKGVLPARHRAANDRHGGPLTSLRIFGKVHGALMKKGIDYIGVGVGGIIFNAEGLVFLARRGREARNESGKWEFPGGGVEFGETLEHALAREILEEYGITIEVHELLDVVNHIIPREGQHWVSPSFLCKMISGTPVIREPHKCEAIGWFAIEEIPETEPDDRLEEEP